MKKKLLLIHPGTRSAFSGFGDTAAWGMPPLALAYVAALTPDSWEIRIVDEYIQELDLAEPADLVGISAYSVNATRAYELATAFRARNIPVVLGGIHASMLPEEAAQFVDTVVVGEAESIWPTVISDFEKGEMKPIYHGERLPLDNLPIPRRDLIPDLYEMDVMQTTRGCPFGCEFCSVTAFNGKAYRQRPVEEVLDELESIPKQLVYIIDDNLFGTGKKGMERAQALFQGMIDRKLKKIWLSQASINIARHPDILKLAYRSGCRSLFVGFESVSPDNLKQVNKGPNLEMKLEDMKRASRTITRHGICVIGSFVLGFDHDDLSAFEKTLSLANETDAVQFQFLTPFPGTVICDQLSREGRIVYNVFPEDWEKCDLDHLMIKPKKLDMVDLIHGVDYLVQETFFSRKVLLRAIRTLFRSRSIAAALFAFNLNKDSANLFAAHRDIRTRGRRLGKQ